MVSHIPIYNDYVSLQKIRCLRTHLIRAHIHAAQARGLKRIKNNEQLQHAITEEKVIPVTSDPEKLFYFYNVPPEHRYLTPRASLCLEKVSTRFQQVLSRYGDFPQIKIAVSSAMRPCSYQRELQNKNINAAIISTHSYGISFDLFYDDYYVVLPLPDSENDTAQKIITDIRRQYGFLLGDALRRQLRSVLMETLITLQNEGCIYAILEEKQRCYHITSLL